MGIGEQKYFWLFGTAPPNPTHHDLHGPDDSQTTIDYHHLDLSRDDGMDEQEIYLYFVQPDGGFLAQKLARFVVTHIFQPMDWEMRMPLH
jgi:hypothetical protein